MTTPTKCWCGGEASISLPQYCFESGLHDPAATGDLGPATKLYIAGPMTGYPDCNYPAFNLAAEVLRGLGYEIVNPAEGLTANAHYKDFLREDLRAMLDCKGVAVLEGWWNSVGARNEVQVAGTIGMPIRSVTDWTFRTHIELI